MQRVVVAIITRKKSGKDAYLLVSSKKNFDKYSGYFYPPGGHQEENESEDQTIKRELKEELNLEIKPITRIAQTLNDLGEETCWWRCEIVSGKIELVPSGNLVKADFFTKEEIEKLFVWPATKKFFKEYIFKFKYHSLVYKIQQVLKNNDYWFEKFEHQPVKTSEEAAKVRHGYSLSQGAKALIMQIIKANKEKEFVMLVVPGDKKFDKKKVKEVLQFKEVRFASEEEIAKITDGVKIGGIPPFGNLFGLRVIVDKGLLDNEKIIFNAGDKSFSIGMKSADYVEIVKPHIGEIT